LARAFFRLALALCMADAGSADADTDGLVVEVDAAQRATVVGRVSSLRTLVEDLCWRAGATLEFYDAADRPAGGTYRDVALLGLLGRLLWRESYMAETAVDPATGAEVLARLRVFGDPATAGARRASGAETRSRAPLQIPPVLLQTALAAPDADPAARQAALLLLAARIAGDAREFQAFLATDSRLIAQAIARFDRAADSLRELRGRYIDPRITTKLDEILAALAGTGGQPAHRVANDDTRQP